MNTAHHPIQALLRAQVHELLRGVFGEGSYRRRWAEGVAQREREPGDAEEVDGQLVALVRAHQRGAQRELAEKQRGEPRVRQPPEPRARRARHAGAAAQ